MVAGRHVRPYVEAVARATAFSSPEARLRMTLCIPRTTEARP